MALGIKTFLFIASVLNIGQIVAEWPLDIAVVMGMSGSQEYQRYINSTMERFREAFRVRTIQSHHRNMRLAYIEFRNHHDENATYVTKLHDFTDDTKELRSWIDNARVTDGEDTPGAMADALNDVKNLSWRKVSTKIAILVTGNLPYGLDPDIDSSFPLGCPINHDPVQIARLMAHCGIALYTVGTGKSVQQYEEFFSALSYITGGIYMHSNLPLRLYDIIHLIGYEWSFLIDIGEIVDKEIEQRFAVDKQIDHKQVVDFVYHNLKKEREVVFTILRNKKIMKKATKLVKKLSDMPSLDEIKVKMRQKIRRVHPRLQMRKMCSHSNGTLVCGLAGLNKKVLTTLHDKQVKDKKIGRLKERVNNFSLDSRTITRAQVDRIVKRQITIFTIKCKYGRLDLADTKAHKPFEDMD